MHKDLTVIGLPATYGMSGSTDAMFYARGADMEGLPLPSVTYDVDAYTGPRRDWRRNVAAMAVWIERITGFKITV